MPSLEIIGLLVLEQKIFKGVYHIWAWRPSWSCDLDHLYTLSFPHPKEVPHKIRHWLAKWFQRRRILKIMVIYDVHLSNVLTDHFSNPVSEKTRNDIPMIFLQCNFKTIFYRLPLPNRGIYLKIIHVRRNAIFMLYRTCIACF